MTFQRYGRLAGFAAAGALALTACGGAGAGGGSGAGGGQQLSGTVQIDGSSTVAPISSAAAELFMKRNAGVRVTVGTSGTGGGFEKFCRGQTDISDASRPITPQEAKTCRQNGIRYDQLTVANDALTIAVNEQNTWAKCLTVQQLRRIWKPNSTITNWNQIDPSYPNVPLQLFGPGTDSGTFDYFTEEIVGKEGASRTDYTASENDNVLVQGVAGSRGGLGYFGYSYFDENRGKLNAVKINSGNGCVAPTPENAQSGQYKPLSRPLFIYPEASAMRRPEVQAFVDFYADNAKRIAKQAQFIPLNNEQLQQLKSKVEKLKRQ